MNQLESRTSAFCLGFPLVLTNEAWSAPGYEYGRGGNYAPPLQWVFTNLQFLDTPGEEDFVYLETAQNLLKGKAFKLENNQPAADVDGNVKKLAQWAALAQYLAEPGVTDLYQWISDRILGRFLAFRQVCRNSPDPQVRWVGCIDWQRWYNKWEGEYISGVANKMQTAREACLREATRAASDQTKLAEAAANRERRTKRGLTQKTANSLATWEKKEQVLKSVNLTPPVDLSFLLQPNGRPNVPPPIPPRKFDGSHQSACDIDIRPCPEQTLSCNEHRCKGKVLAGHNNAAATCTTDRLLACPCVADGDTPGYKCGKPQSCKAHGCDGKASYPDGKLEAKCQNNFAGCHCLAYKGMPGFSCPEPQPSCGKHQCGGSVPSKSRLGFCNNNFLDCECTPDSKTPGYCPYPWQTCYECEGNDQNVCQNPGYRGCLCQPEPAPSAPPASSPPQEPPPPTSTPPAEIPKASPAPPLECKPM